MQKTIISLLFIFISIFVCYADDYYQVVSTNRLNVRSSPSTSAAVIDQLDPGQTVQGLSDDGMWLKVQLNNGRYGYVASKYVKYFTSTNEDVTQKSEEVNQTNKMGWLKMAFSGEKASALLGPSWFYVGLLLIIVGCILIMTTNLKETDSVYYYPFSKFLVQNIGAIMQSFGLLLGIANFNSCIYWEGFWGYLIGVIIIGAIIYALFFVITGKYIITVFTILDASNFFSPMFYGTLIVAGINALSMAFDWSIGDTISIWYYIAVCCFAIYLLIIGSKNKNFGYGLIAAISMSITWILYMNIMSIFFAIAIGFVVIMFLLYLFSQPGTESPADSKKNEGTLEGPYMEKIDGTFSSHDLFLGNDGNIYDKDISGKWHKR